ncbi:MAG: hypothetical protein COX19_15620 [Desulfobacterales bacterium CG23_combo_of_CG06-09_8_20_14_all_51_8]|nr:MAG: hypothetical protein COX19_15620 [Desulfobacterales bacterium CG23_combo_of_CG06-09_8_20_14_all_51_8]
MNKQNPDFLPTEPHFATFPDVLAFRARYQPEKTAFTFLSGKDRVAVTYDEVFGRVRSLSQMLCENHLNGERAILLYPSGLDFVVGFLACLCAGVIAVPASPPGTDRLAERVKNIISDADAVVILTNREVLAHLKKLRVLKSLTAFPGGGSLSRFLLRKAGLSSIPDWGNIPMIATDALKTGDGTDFHPPDISEDAVAFLQYTSGSTGTPKGVMVTHKNMLHNSGLIGRATRISPASVVFSWLPMFHDMGIITGVICPVHAGFLCHHMSPMDFIRDPLSWLRQISENQVTHSGGPNFAYALCVRRFDPGALNGVDLSSWQVAFCGAEPVRPETLSRFADVFAPYGFRAETLMPCYGLAESTVGVCWAEFGNGPTYKDVDAEFLKQGIVAPPRSLAQTRRLAGSGRVESGLDIVIADPETDERLPEDQVGEIQVAGDSVAAGYWNQPDLSAEVFNNGPADGGKRYLRTGDLGFISDGELYVAGRIKDLIIIRGKNHYPQDIEATVEKAHPAVRQGGVAAFSTEISGTEALVVLLEVRSGQEGAWDEIIRAVRRAVSVEHQLAPHAVVLLSPRTLAKTSSGKLQRGGSRLLFENNQLAALRTWTRGNGD